MLKHTFAALSISLVAVSTTSAQVVQLPVTRNFSVQGGAWVPDAGTGTYGGYRSSRYGSRRTPLGRSYGGSISPTSVAVSVEIIDLQALDDAILNRNTAAPNNVISADSPAADGSRQYLGPLAPQRPLTMQSRVAPDAWHRTMAGKSKSTTLHPELAESNIRYYLQQGKQAEALGRVNASRVYYRMAIQSMTPEMLERYRKVLADRKKAKTDDKAANRKQF